MAEYSVSAGSTKVDVKGQTADLTGTERIVGGSLQIGDDVIDVKGKTLNEIIDAITGLGYENLTASIVDGRFTITFDGTPEEILATGDFARVTGFAEYNIEEGTMVPDQGDTIITMQGMSENLTGSVVVLNGTIKVGDGAEINAKGKTLDQIVSEINAQGLDGITASIKDGKFTIESTNGVPSILATGDFARVTGMADYTVDKADVEVQENQIYKDSFTNSIQRLTEQDAIAQGYTVIKTADDLSNIRNNLSGKYILMNDIDLSSIANWDSIGDSSNAFSGILDGNGYVIKNLAV